MKEPCDRCPFRSDVKPFLRPRRGEELAYATTNKYNSFPCHKTTVPDESSDSGNMLATDKSKECAGFLTMQIIHGKAIPKDFMPAYDLVYGDCDDMIWAYNGEDEND